MAGDECPLAFLLTELSDVVSEPVVVVAVVDLEHTLSTSLSHSLPFLSPFRLLLWPPLEGSSPSSSLLSQVSEEEEEPEEDPDPEELELVLATRFRRCRRLRFLEGSQQSQK